MSYKNDSIYIFLKPDAPFDFIAKTLKQVLPEKILLQFPDKDSSEESFNSLEPDMILSYSAKDRNDFYRLCNLTAEALSLQYGRKFETEQQSFLFYYNSEFYTFLYDNDNPLCSESSSLIFTDDKPRFLTKEEQSYYFDDENEEHLEELNEKHEWLHIDFKIAFTSYYADYIDKGRTDKDFQQYVAGLIPLFEKHSIQQNLHINCPTKKHKTERI